MKKTTSGFRAHAFEAIEAAEKGTYLDKVLYLIEGLPGIWRRVRLPKGDPAAVGLVQCWFIDGPVALEYSAAASEEFKQACDIIKAADTLAHNEAISFVQELREKRTDFLISEKKKDDGAPVAEKPAPTTPGAASVTGEPSEGPAATPSVEL